MSPGSGDASSSQTNARMPADRGPVAQPGRVGDEPVGPARQTSDHRLHRAPGREVAPDVSGQQRQGHQAHPHQDVERTQPAVGRVIRAGVQGDEEPSGDQRAEHGEPGATRTRLLRVWFGVEPWLTPGERQDGERDGEGPRGADHRVQERDRQVGRTADAVSVEPGQHGRQGRTTSWTIVTPRWWASTAIWPGVSIVNDFSTRRPRRSRTPAPARSGRGSCRGRRR